MTPRRDFSISASPSSISVDPGQNGDVDDLDRGAQRRRAERQPQRERPARRRDGLVQPGLGQRGRLVDDDGDVGSATTPATYTITVTGTGSTRNALDDGQPDGDAGAAVRLLDLGEPVERDDRAGLERDVDDLDRGD